jgi:nucleotide-binding universal stress UspA family protein
MRRPLSVVEPPEDDLALRDEARAYVSQMATQLTAKGLGVSTITQWGKPAARILDKVRSHHADLVVMSTHGLARLVLGSVATGTLQPTSVPLMLLGPAALGETRAMLRHAPECQLPEGVGHRLL